MSGFFIGSRGRIFPNGLQREDTCDKLYDLDAMHRDAGNRYHDPFPAAEPDLAETVPLRVFIGDDLAHADIVPKPAGEVQIHAYSAQSCLRRLPVDRERDGGYSNIAGISLVYMKNLRARIAATKAQNRLALIVRLTTTQKDVYTKYLTCPGNSPNLSEKVTFIFLPNASSNNKQTQSLRAP